VAPENVDVFKEDGVSDGVEAHVAHVWTSGEEVVCEFPSELELDVSMHLAEPHPRGLLGLPYCQNVPTEVQTVRLIRNGLCLPINSFAGDEVLLAAPESKHVQLLERMVAPGLVRVLLSVTSALIGSRVLARSDVAELLMQTVEVPHALLLGDYPREWWEDTLCRLDMIWPSATGAPMSPESPVFQGVATYLALREVARRRIAEPFRVPRELSQAPATPGAYS